MKLTEYMSIALNEKTCLSVSRRRLCPKERCDLLERAERPAESSSQDAQIRTLLDRQKERILAECQAEINRHEFQAGYDRRSSRKLGEIIESQQEELQKNFNDEINSFFMDSYCSKIWNYVKLIRKVSVKWKN